MADLSGVEVPRLVKKPGARKRVENMQELVAALKDGWVLRLEAEPIPDVLDDPDGAPPAEEPAEPSLASELTADLEAQEQDAAERKSTRPSGKKK